MVKAEKVSKKNKSAGKTVYFTKGIRILTIAPLMALLTLSLLFWLHPAVFSSTLSFLLSVIFLVAMPVLGYPLQPVLPYFKHQGREGQRNLAMAMAMLGYLCGLAYSVFGGVTKSLLVIYLTYFLSGVGILVFNKLFHIRASGHACGVAGPVALLVYFLGPAALPGILLLALVFYASLKMHRHTLPQLFAGSFISLVSLIIALLLIAP